MKKRNLLFSAIAGMMFFTACSSEEDVPNSGLDNAVQEINLQVANYGDELQSRAGRPLLSDEAAQNIDHVTLFICDASSRKIVYTQTVDSWMTDGVSDKYDNGRQKKIVLQGDDKLSQGSYKIYAFGYSNESDYDLSAITGFAKGGNYTENIVLSYKAGKNIPEEIFAGSIELGVTTNKSFTKNVVLNRQVAGAYIYAFKIPMETGLALDSKLQLVASDANDQLVLGYFANVDLNANGTNTGNDVKYVVNGAKAGTPSTVICSTTLGEWYSKIEDANKDGIVDPENWIATADDADRKGTGYVKGSVFAANFVIPFKKIDNTHTLVLQLVSADGKTIFRHWNVNLPNTELATRLYAWNGSTFALAESYNESQQAYSIVRNHLYSIGHKAKNGNPNDPDPTPDPDDPDPDPEDLSKAQNLILKVNHNWEVIHQMELD